MFFSANTDHPFWWITIEVIIHLIIFVIITSMVVFLLRGPMRKYKPADLYIFKKLEKWHNPFNNRMMTALTILGKHHFLVPAYLVLITLLLIFGNHGWYAYRIAIMALSSLLLMFILKQLFHRNRPSDPLLDPAKGKSFPSGHAIMSVNFFGILLYMLFHTETPSYIKIIAAILVVILIIAIGFSRVYLQVHYASDVLAGFIIGCCWFYISLHALNRLHEVMM